MSVSVENGIVRLVAPSRVEDAEPLWGRLDSHRKAGTEAMVDLSASGPLHAAVLQVLLAFQPSIEADFTDPFQRRWVSPLLRPAGPVRAIDLRS